MAWAAMVQEEVQKHLNDDDESDINAIYIIYHYWKSTSGEQMVKGPGSYGLGDEAVESDDVKID